MSAETEAEEHDELIRQAQALNRENRDREAFSFYLQAYRRFPQCPLIGIGLATSLRALDRDTTALAVCRSLEERSDESLLAGNPRMSCTIEELRYELDLETFRAAYWVYYQEWEPTGFYLLRHLEARLEGMKSVYDWSEVRDEVVDFAEGLEKVDPRLPELIEKLDQISPQKAHEKLLEQGDELFDEDRFREAYPILLKALRLQPHCPMAAFGLARCLDELDRNSAALQLLLELSNRSDRSLSHGCPDMDWSAEELRIDLDYTAFRVANKLGEDRESTAQFLVRHLEARTRGVDSIYDWEDAFPEISEFVSGLSEVGSRLSELIDRVTALDEHARFFEQAHKFYDQRRYRKAIPLYLKALRRVPQCATAAYNVANCLYQLDRLSASLAVLRSLEERSDESLRAGCPDDDVSVAELRCDLAYLAFLVNRQKYSHWSPAGEYLITHLEARLRGTSTIFKWTDARKEISKFAENAKGIDPRLTPLIEQLERLHSRGKKKDDSESIVDPDQAAHQEHETIYQQGGDLYKEDRFREAYPVLLKALRLQPDCSMAAFTIARCLYHLERNELSLKMTLALQAQSDESLTEGCPGVEWSAEEFRLDLDYAAFLVTREMYEDWSPAGEYLLRHLIARDRGVPSIYEWENLCEVVEEFTESSRTVDPRLGPLMKRLQRFEEHRESINKARELGEEENDRRAYPYFLKAWRGFPESAVAAYEVAYTLYALERYKTALSVLLHLEGWSDEELARRTPSSERTVEEIRADLAFLGFLITKNLYSGWSPAGDYLLKNLEARARGADPGFPWESWSNQVREFAEDPLTSDPRLTELIEILDRQAAEEVDSDEEE